MQSKMRLSFMTISNNLWYNDRKTVITQFRHIYHNGAPRLWYNSHRTALIQIKLQAITAFRVCVQPQGGFELLGRFADIEAAVSGRSGGVRLPFDRRPVNSACYFSITNFSGEFNRGKTNPTDKN